jgi:hypothetical protein
LALELQRPRLYRKRMDRQEFRLMTESVRMAFPHPGGKGYLGFEGRQCAGLKKKQREF